MSKTKSFDISPHHPAAKTQRGFALPTTVIFMVLLSVLGLTALMTADLSVQTSANYRASKNAFYVAEAGLQRALSKLQADGNWAYGLSDYSNAFAGDNTLNSGYYTVEVFLDDPAPGKIRLRSTGTIVGRDPASATVEIVGRPGFPEIFRYALLNCGNLHLQGSADNSIIGGKTFVGGNFHVSSSGTNLLQTDIEVLGSLDLNSGQIVGDVTSNSGIDLESPAVPNVSGDATSAADVTGNGVVTGTVTENVTPDPVVNICQGTELARLMIPYETIQTMKSNADLVIPGAVLTTGISVYSGIVHITGDLQFFGDVELLDNVIFIVDGNVHINGPGSIGSSSSDYTATVIVPEGNLHIQGSGSLELDGTLQAGAVSADGSRIYGGNLHVQSVSSLTIHGSLLIPSGNMHSQGDANLIIDYQPPKDYNLGEGAGFIATDWRDVR